MAQMRLIVVIGAIGLLLIIFSVPFFILVWLRAYRFSYRVVEIWAKLVMVEILLFGRLGYEMQVEPGAEPYIKKGQDAIFAAQHQSFWEAFALFDLLFPIFVLKRALLRLPLLGYYLKKLGMIDIDRSAGVSALRAMLVAARSRMAERRPLVIFPEGTRNPEGHKIRLQPGVFVLYRELALPVVPITHDAGRFWHRDGIRPGSVTLTIKAPIPTGLPRTEFMASLANAFYS